jgi:hypothetical protein
VPAAIGSGSPLGSYWCALSVGVARKAGGLWVPSHDAGSCNEWVYQATRAGLIRKVPEPGAAVVYTNGTTVSGGRYDGQRDAVHIGIVLRVEPVLLSIEGNTVISAFDRNGFVQALKEVFRDRRHPTHPGENSIAPSANAPRRFHGTNSGRMRVVPPNDALAMFR